MRSVQWVSAGVCAGLLFVGSVSFAETSSPPTTQTPATDAPSDKDFLVRALRVNRLELLIGQMALKRGTTAEVKATGQKMVQKHTEFGRQLSALAQIAPKAGAPKLSADQQSTLVRLASLSGDAFDRSFKDAVDSGHVQELAMYRDEMSHAVDSRLRALVQGRVATLQQTVAKANQAMNSSLQTEDW
jgi:putative membrane protein